MSRNNRRALLFKRFSTSESSDIPPIRYLARQRTDNHISDCNGPFIRKYMSVFLFTAPPPDLSTTVVGIISTSHAFSSDVGKHSELLKSIFRAILLYNLVMNTIVSLVIGEYYRPRSKFDQHP